MSDRAPTPSKEEIIDAASRELRFRADLLDLLDRKGFVEVAVHNRPVDFGMVTSAVEPQAMAMAVVVFTARRSPANASPIFAEYDGLRAKVWERGHWIALVGTNEQDRHHRLPLGEQAEGTEP